MCVCLRHVKCNFINVVVYKLNILACSGISRLSGLVWHTGEKAEKQKQINKQICNFRALHLLNCFSDYCDCSFRVTDCSIRVSRPQ